MKRTSARFQEQATQNVAEEVAEVSTKAKRKKKRKDKTEEIDVAMNEYQDHEEAAEGTNSMWDMGQAEGSDDQTGKKKKKKKKKDKKIEVKEEYEEMDIDEQKVDPALLVDQKANGELLGSWPREKMIELLDRISENIPDNDNLKYSSRLARLDWNAISFDDYSSTDCEKMWKKVQDKSRCYRLLGEIISEAKNSLQQRSNSFYYALQKHPEKPTKPLTSFMLFYMDTKDKIQRDHPGTNGAELAKKVATLWKEINPKKLEKYKAKAQKLRLEYEAKLAEFYQNNPDFEEKPRRKVTKTKYGFEKPKSAFQLYLEACRQTNKPRQIDEKTFVEEMKIQWKDLAETAKVSWIELAQKQEEEYRTNLQKYQSEHPDFVPPTVKTLITKNELNVLEICSGRPKKPPSNAYSLYSVHMLQSPVLKNIPAKERLAEVSKRWKALKQSERDDYSKKLIKLQEEYVKQYEKYLNSLTPQKRMEEEAKNKTTTKKKKNKEEPVVFMSEPEKPPTDVVEFFRIKNEAKWKKNKADALIYAKKKWEKLSKPEKKQYIQELRKINDEYIENYGKFLQQCPPHKVSEYLNTIVRHKQELTTKDQFEESEDSEPDSESDS